MCVHGCVRRGTAVGDTLEFRFDAVFDEKDVNWLNQVRTMLEGLITDEVFKRQSLRESSLQMKRMYVGIRLTRGVGRVGRDGAAGWEWGRGWRARSVASRARRLGPRPLH